MSEERHSCLHLGAQSSSPKISVPKKVPESGAKIQKWNRDQTGVSQECAALVMGLATMVPNWWTLCWVRTRWETPEQGSVRGRDSTICIRIKQCNEGVGTRNRSVNAKEVEEELLCIVNQILAQCFPNTLGLI
jgi:hypothetical protein